MKVRICSTADSTETININLYQGHLCRGAVCVPGCQTNADCGQDSHCVKGQCADPCLSPNSGCATSAECRISNHRAVCICPQGLQGNPAIECKRVECTQDGDCESNKQCKEGSCINPCALPNACGINAQCKTLRHVKDCSCPNGFIGNPNIECSKDKNHCLSNPCGQNSICQSLVGGYDCRCKTGCTGDPFTGCLCGGSLVDPCSGAICGLGAECKVQLNQVRMLFYKVFLFYD